MKIKLFIAVVGIFFAISFSSCLKDNPYLNLSNTQPIIEFGQSAANSIYGLNGYYGAFLYVPENVTYDTTIVASDTTITTITPLNDTAIALVLASPQVLNDTVAVTFTIDTSQIAPYNSALDSNYIALPDTLNGSSLYTLNNDTAHLSLTQTINILPGHRVGSIPIVLNFPAFPASYRYAFPISIVNAVDKEDPSNLIIVSGNSGKFMWLLSQ